MSRATATLRKAARRGRGRRIGGQRTLVGLVGLLLAAGAVAALLVGFGVFGAGRAHRPVADPIAVHNLGSHLTLTRALATAVGVMLLVLGLLWASRALRPEPSPDLILDARPATRLTITSSAISDALAGDAEALPGVDRARARLVGHPAAPAVRLTLWLIEGTDLREVYDDLDTHVLSRARESLGLGSLPTAIRLELDAAAASRVI